MNFNYKYKMVCFTDNANESNSKKMGYYASLKDAKKDLKEQRESLINNSDSVFSNKKNKIYIYNGLPEFEFCGETFAIRKIK